MSQALDPEQFRLKIGNYKERWYHDPLPGCDIAQQDLDWRAPAVSTIKQASSKDWTQIAMRRAADWVHKWMPDFSESDADSVYEALSQANSNALDAASNRGIQIHKMFEMYADGDDPDDIELSVEAMAYRETVLRCIRTTKPNIVMSEFICFSRSVGYGGTGDAIWDMHFGPFDGLYLVDYKSRTERHAVYIEEAWQVTAYAKADYVIGVTGSVGAVETIGRMRLPELAGGCILSITPESYEFYPVDLEAAWPGFLTLRRHWQHRSDGKAHIFGKGWQPSMTRDEWVRDRIERIKSINLGQLRVNWPADVPGPKLVEVYTDEQIDLIIPAVEFAETELHIEFPATDPTRPHKRPHEIAMEAKLAEWSEPVRVGTLEGAVYVGPVGHPVPAEGELRQEVLPLIAHRWSLLQGTKQEWINSVVAEAMECDLPFRVSEQPTRRRVAIAKALIRMAEEHFSIDDIQACLSTILLLEPHVVAAMPLGAAIGMMDYNEAERFLDLVKIVKATSVNATGPADNPDFQYMAKGENLGYDKDGEKTVILDKVSPREKAIPATTARPAKKAAAKKAAAPRKPRKKAN